MKHFVKRDKFKTYVKSKVEFDVVGDWTTIHMALNHYAKWMQDNGFDTADDVDTRKLYEDVTDAIDALHCENEMPWR